MLLYSAPVNELNSDYTSMQLFSPVCYFQRRKGCDRMAGSLSQGTQWGSACTELEHRQENCQTSQGENIVKWRKIAQYSFKNPTTLEKLN